MTVKWLLIDDKLALQTRETAKVGFVLERHQRSLTVLNERNKNYEDYDNLENGTLRNPGVKMEKKTRQTNKQTKTGGFPLCRLVNN